MLIRKVSSIFSSSSTIDKSWFKKFKAASKLELLELLNVDKESFKREEELFLSGEKDCPDFTYTFIKPPKVLRARKQFSKLAQKIAESDLPIVIKNAYRQSISDKILKLDMLEATSKKDDALFSELSQKLYGRPEKNLYFSLVSDFHKKYEPLLTDKIIGADAKEFLKTIPVSSQEFVYTPHPTPEEFLLVKSRLLPRFTDLLDLADPHRPKNYSAQEIAQVFRKALQKRGLRNWKVLISKTSRSAINTQNNKRQILIPETREMNGEVLQEILAHEIGCHVTRSIQGLASGFSLLSLGLSDYEASEEGLATVAQQILGDSFVDYSGRERYFSIGLALGVDGTPRNFREVFECLKKYFLLERYLSDPSESREAHLEKAITQAWTATVRTFRGTAGKTTGACFTKDLIYREGNIRVWETLLQTPGSTHDFFFGKLDPSIAEHQELLFWLKNNHPKA